MKSIRMIALIGVVVLVLVSHSLLADQNLHVLVGTMDGCGCEFYPVLTPFGVQNDWICYAHFVVAAPNPHWDEVTPAFVTAEIEEQAIGQCAEISPTLPRDIRMLFWLESGGIDYVHGGILRSPIKGYYLIPPGSTS